jgi:hypothetical protein
MIFYTMQAQRLVPVNKHAGDYQLDESSGKYVLVKKEQPKIKK